MKDTALGLSVTLALLLGFSSCQKETATSPNDGHQAALRPKINGQNWRVVEDENGKFTCPGRGEECLVYSKMSAAQSRAFDRLFAVFATGDVDQVIAEFQDGREVLSQVLDASHIDAVIAEDLIAIGSYNEVTDSRFVLIRDSYGDLVIAYMLVE